MHLERASYQELKAIQAKVEERLLVVPPDDDGTIVHKHFTRLMKLIENGEMLAAVKKHKQHSGLGLRSQRLCR